MPDTVEMTYGDYDFATQAGPIPFLTINRVYNKSADGATQLSTLFTATLEGTLTPLRSGVWGYINLDTMQDRLMSGFSGDGRHFHVTCNSNTMISQYPRIREIRLDRSDDNWVQTTPYTINLEWNENPVSGDVFLESIEETWELEVTDESSEYDWSTNGTGDYNVPITRVTHRLSAKGSPQYSGGVLIRDPWQHALAWVETRSGYQGLDMNTGYNHMRLINIDEVGGIYSVVESWVVMTDHPLGRAIEDFTATNKYNVETDLSTITVEGSIQGLEIREYSPNYNVTQMKYVNASGFWNNVRPRLFGRAKLVAGNSVNPLPADTVVAHNPTKGLISYNYSYDTRPCNFLTGSLFEDINIVDNLPNDIFASITIPGRGAGVLLQDIGTTTSHSRTVEINALIAKPTGCSSVTSVFATRPTAQVEALLCQLYQEISGVANQIFVSQNNESFNVKNGRYSRQITWVLSYCSGQLISTDVC